MLINVIPLNRVASHLILGNVRNACIAYQRQAWIFKNYISKYLRIHIRWTCTHTEVSLAFWGTFLLWNLAKLCNMFFTIRFIQIYKEKIIYSVTLIYQTKEVLRGGTLTIKCGFLTFSRLSIKEKIYVSKTFVTAREKNVRFLGYHYH